MGRHFSDDEREDEPGTLTTLINEPHYPLGHVMLQTRHLIEPLGIHNPVAQRLGKGSFGAAYEISLGGKRSVLKFTRDPSEAEASLLLAGKSHKNIVGIHKAWALSWTHRRDLLGWFVIHREYLNPISKKDIPLMDVLWVLYEDMSLDLKFPKANSRAMLDKWKSYIREELQELGMHTPQNLHRAMTLLTEASTCVHAMHAAGIDWEDFHHANMMRRDDGTMAIGDVGFGIMHREVRGLIPEMTKESVGEYRRSLAA
jgi:hypothetical protein